MARRALGAVLMVVALAGCAPGAGESEAPSADGSSSSGTVAETPTADVDAQSTDPETSDATTPVDTLPDGFPDPASLIGKTISTDWGGDEDSVTTADGVPLSLVETSGACFDGGTADTCAYALDVLAPAGSDGVPEASTASLVMLLRAISTTGDGSAVWQAVDAIVVHPPDGTPALLEACDGPQTAAFYIDESVPVGDSIPVAAAWGPNADSTALVELDPTSLSCSWMGG